MASSDEDESELPRARSCGAYWLGHDVHFIQVRLSAAAGSGVEFTITSIGDDGTITGSDGTRLWNHDPSRLRVVAERHGNVAELGHRGVLVCDTKAVPIASVSRLKVDRARARARVTTGGSLVDELIRRGGVVRSVRSVLDELGLSV